MIELLTLLMMLHGLTLLLLAMPKYNKQVLAFPKKNKELEQVFKHTGAVLVFVSVAISMFYKGIGVGIAWSCALVTLAGTVLSVTFSMNSNKVAMFLVYLPTKLFGGINMKTSAFFLTIYLMLTLLIFFSYW